MTTMTKKRMAAGKKIQIYNLQLAIKASLGVCVQMQRLYGVYTEHNQSPGYSTYPKHLQLEYAVFRLYAHFVLY